MQRAHFAGQPGRQLVEGAHEAGQVAGVACALAVGRMIVGNGGETLRGDMAHQRIELAGAAGPAVHQQPQWPLTEPIAHQYPFAGMDGLFHQTGRLIAISLIALGGEQQLAGGALGMAGGESVVQPGADTQQPFAGLKRRVLK